MLLLFGPLLLLLSSSYASLLIPELWVPGYHTLGIGELCSKKIAQDK